jgi:hypothetical protein
LRELRWPQPPKLERLVMRGLERDCGLQDTRKVPLAALSAVVGRARP